MKPIESLVRPPQQRRSRASFERVLDAGTKLLEEKGWSGFTLAEVSQRAGVSIGSIYKRVPSKEALFYAIHDRFTERTKVEEREFADPDRYKDLPTQTLVENLIRTFAQDWRQNAPILTVFMHRGAVDEGIAARGSAVSIALGHLFKNVLLTRRDEITQAKPERAVDVAWRMVYCTFARQLMYGPTFESDLRIEWDELVSLLSAACHAYLFGER